MKRFAADESGATAVEYGLIMAMVFLAIVGAVSAFADGVSLTFDTVSDTVTEAVEEN